MPKTVQKRAIMPQMAQFQPIEFRENLPIVLNPHTDPKRPGSSLHYHNAVEISLCTRGRGIFFIQENVHPYQEGTLVQVAPNVLHIAHSEGRQDPQWLTLYIDLQYMGSILSVESLSLKSVLGSKVMDTSTLRSIKGDLLRLLHEYFHRDKYSRLSMLGHVHVLLAELSRCRSLDQSDTTIRNPGFERIAPALNMIASQLDEPLSVQALASECGMSESNFRRTFLSVIGDSPHQYILNTRIQFSKTLLQDRSISVLEIAGRCGFETLSTFNRAFLKRSGMSPRQYRNASGESGKPRK